MFIKKIYIYIYLLLETSILQKTVYGALAFEQYDSGRDCLPNISRLRWSQTKLFQHGKLIPFLTLTLIFMPIMFHSSRGVKGFTDRSVLRPHLSNLINDYFVHTF